jgi:hypothetical protein
MDDMPFPPKIISIVYFEMSEETVAMGEQHGDDNDTINKTTMGRVVMEPWRKSQKNGELFSPNLTLRRRLAPGG